MGLTERAIELLGEATTALPGGGEARPGQVEMSTAVAETIKDSGHLIVAAGTGTGKSLAYLAPVVASGQRTVIATATKALQDQLANKELPHLQEVSSKPFEWAVLKGRNNYACRQRVNEASNDKQQALAGLRDSVEEEVERLVEWADTTVTGDRAELDFEPSPAAWSAVSVTSRECPGRSKCPAGEICLAEAARTKAAEADVVVINTHLLGIDVLTEGAVLPDYQILVVDEVHQLEDVITSTCGSSLTGGRFNAFARTLAAILDSVEVTDGLEDVGALLSNALEPLVGQRINPSDHPDLVSALSIGRAKVEEAISHLKKIPKSENADANARKERASQAANALQAELVGLDKVGDDDVAWVEQNFNNATLRVAPLDVGKVLKPGLWEDRIAILTSATIPDTMAGALGMDADSHTFLDVGSPFDYANQGLLYCAQHLPEPRSPNYEEQVLPHLEELILAAGGATLALFTSWRMMDAAADHLVPRMPWPVRTQRDLPKAALIEEFLENPESILLATMGFWQGIDIPGASLSLVTIDRLPFPRPDDPLLEARREHAGRMAFRTVDLARATTLLAQGAGRLIRTSTDEGVVAVLDGRLATKKSYRWDFINALPPFTRTSDPEVAMARLRQTREARGGEPAET